MTLLNINLKGCYISKQAEYNQTLCTTIATHCLSQNYVLAEGLWILKRSIQHNMARPD